MEVAVASVVIGVMFAALLSGLTSSVTNVQFGREQIRATQIMVEKLDTIRLYRWEKINSAYIPSTFTETYYPTSSGSNDPRLTSPSLSLVSGGTVQSAPAGAANLTYAGTIQISDPGLTEPYAANIKQVTVSLRWQSHGRTVQRDMTTLISKYGLQLYVP